MDLELWRKTKRERGITYQNISDHSGIPLGTIKNIFAGYTPDPRESTIKAIERALGVETNIVHHMSNFSANEIQLIEDYRKLPADLQHRVSAYIEKLVDLTKDEQIPFTKKNSRNTRVPGKKTI